MRALLFAMAAVGAALASSVDVSASSSIEVRLLNEVTTEASLLAAGAATAITRLTPYSMSAYVSVLLNDSLTVSTTANPAPLPVMLPATAAPGQRFTVAVYGQLQEQSVVVFSDLAEQQPTDGIDFARVRVLNFNSAAKTVTVFGVTSNCFNCLLPQLSYPAAPRSAAVPFDGDEFAYFAVPVAHPFRLGLFAEPAGVYLLNTTFPGWWEHGVYTVVLHDSSEASTDSYEDVKGNNTWIPLAWALMGVALAFLGAKVFDVAIPRCMRSGDGEGVDDDMRDPAAVRSVNGRDLAVKPRSSPRVEAIDTFRGICLSIMIFVNYGGGGYWWLDHSRWNGLTVADLVFPCFVWTMGASMAISLRSQRKSNPPKLTIAGRMTVRAMKLFAVGLFLNDGTDLSNWRVLGVLQYFGVAALVVSLIDVFVPKFFHGCGALCETDDAAAGNGFAGRFRGGGGGGGGGGGVSGFDAGMASSLLGSDASGSYGFGGIVGDGTFDGISKSGGGGSGGGRRSAARADVDDETLDVDPSEYTRCRRFFGDLYPYALEWFWILGFEAIYLCVQYLLKVPGCPTGYIGAGGLADQGLYPNCTGGAHRYIDLQIFGERHMYHGVDWEGNPVSAATCADTYDCDVYDPEGTLGAISAVIICWMGLQAGRILLAHQPKLERGDDGEENPGRGQWELVARWTTWGVILGAIGTGLAGASKNDGVIPLNKNLWSPSFICVMSGIAFCSVALLYLIIDRWNWWTGNPFRFLGKNSIVIYAGSEILQGYFPFTVTAKPMPNGDFASHSDALIANLVGVGAWMLVAFYLYRQKIFVKL